jgi:hypothetical protein
LRIEIFGWLWILLYVHRRSWCHDHIAVAFTEAFIRGESGKMRVFNLESRKPRFEALRQYAYH